VLQIESKPEGLRFFGQRPIQSTPYIQGNATASLQLFSEPDERITGLFDAFLNSHAQLIESIQLVKTSIHGITPLDGVLHPRRAPPDVRRT
jgi:hypothetical protein